MKNKILLSVMLLGACTFSTHVNAQLEVQSSGNVKISKNVAVEASVDNNVSINISHTSKTSSPYYGIQSVIKTNSSMPTSSIYGICGFADASLTSSSLSGSPIVGVFGKSTKNNGIISNFSAGVAGLAHYYGGIGVYGAITSGTTLSLPTSWKNAAYAGYFDGTVKVNGTLYATTVSTTSDLRYKDNIHSIPYSLCENIHLLNPVSYTLKQDSAWKDDIEAKELQGIHYGLIAQDLQKIYPELVYERGGQLSINYIELIPLLIKTVQELSIEVNELKAQISQTATK